MKMRLVRVSFWFQNGRCHVDSRDSKMITFVVFFNNLCKYRRISANFPEIRLRFFKMALNIVVIFNCFQFIVIRSNEYTSSQHTQPTHIIHLERMATSFSTISSHSGLKEKRHPPHRPVQVFVSDIILKPDINMYENPVHFWLLKSLFICDKMPIGLDALLM